MKKKLSVLTLAIFLTLAPLFRLALISMPAFADESDEPAVESIEDPVEEPLDPNNLNDPRNYHCPSPYTPYEAACYDPEHTILFRIGDAILTTHQRYYQNGAAVASCELGFDGCMAYAPDGFRLQLKNYIGPELDRTASPLNLATTIEFFGENTINARGEFGIKTATEDLHFRTDSPDSHLTINVDSPTSTANGILSVNGRVDFESQVRITFNIHSAVPETIQTTSNVTAVTAALQIYFTVDDEIVVNNPTGNFPMYAQAFYATVATIYPDNDPREDIYYDKHVYYRATYKITDGVGDAYGGPAGFINNFYLDDYNNPPYHVSADNAHYTVSYQPDGTRGYYQVLLRIGTVNAKVDTSLTAGESLTSALARLKSTLRRDDTDLPDAYCAPSGCRSPYFAIDVDSAEIINRADSPLLRARTLRATPSAVDPEGDYVLRIYFSSTNPDYGFNHTGSYAIINGRAYWRGYLENITADGYHIWFDIPLTVLPAPASDPEPSDPEPTIPDDPLPTPPESTILPDPTDPLIDPEPPVEPTTAEPEPTEPEPVVELEQPAAEPVSNPLTSATSLGSLVVLFLLALAIFVLQLTYHVKALLSLRRDGLRQNHATPPGRL